MVGEGKGPQSQAGREGCQCRGQAEGEQRAPAKVCLAQARTAPSRGATCQPAALRIAVPAGPRRGRAGGLGTLSGPELGPSASVVSRLVRSLCDLCLEGLRRGPMGPSHGYECVCACPVAWGRGWRACWPQAGVAGLIIIRVVVVHIRKSEADTDKLPTHVHPSSSFRKDRITFGAGQWTHPLPDSLAARLTRAPASGR